MDKLFISDDSATVREARCHERESHQGVTMSENRHSEPAKTTHRIRSFIIHVRLLLLAVLLGFVPMWLKSRQGTSRLAEAERKLNLARMENSLGSAALHARRGDYETARLAASDFYTALLAATSTDAHSALSQAQQDGAHLVLGQRDDLITLLARADAASADLLADLYVSYCGLMSS
jgi:hypothetical protein